MSKKIEYPRVVYILIASSYNVRKVTLVRPWSDTVDYGGYTAAGKFHPKREVFASKAGAIKSGRATLKRRQKHLDASLLEVKKLGAALDKAESAS